MTFADALKSGPALVAWGVRAGVVTPAKPGRHPAPDRYARAAELGICREHVLRPVPVVPGKTRCRECVEKLRKASLRRKR